MSAVTAQIVLRFAAASAGPESAAALLAPLGLSPDLDPATALSRLVDAEAYYALLERAAGDHDPGLPLRYGASVRPEDFGAMGLALKTASTVGEALARIVRYVLVITNSLEYALVDEPAGRAFVMRRRPPHRLGAGIANEGALAAVTSLLRQITDAPVAPTAVSFRHPAPASVAAHEAFFGGAVSFEAARDALALDEATLAARTRLADEGLSAYLIAQLEAMRAQRLDRSVATRVHRAVTDALCDGPPSRARIARRLGMSDRTLHRRLADEGLTFKDVANRARREVAESLLALPDHSLAEVAFLTGFADQSAFQRAFKRWSGRTPLAFRQAATR